MTAASEPAASDLTRDLTAGVVVFLVALPLCLGVALASNAPLLSGVLAGVVGGVLVGMLSGSHTSVSGPAAGLTAVVAAQIAALGSFPAFLLAVVFAGSLQIGLGLVRSGFLAAFVPSSVVRGLLAAIGVILILKQIPHVLGHDPDPEGDLAFQQPDARNTFSALLDLLGGVEPGAAVVGLGSVLLLVVWGRWGWLKRTRVPAPLVVVLLGVAAAEAFRWLGEPWLIAPTHLVQVPVPAGPGGFLDFLQLPDFSRWNDPAVATAAVTLAAVASLETLLNLEAVDKLDPHRRASPPDRELLAQGVGNVVSGLVGGLPVTSVIVRSSVNIDAGARTKRATVAHGVLLLACVVLLPAWLNRIPLASLAAILLVAGVRLASPALVRRMWSGGRDQFAPFVVTLAAIVLTDLLVGVLIGLGVSAAFILWSSARHPLRRVVEKHPAGDLLHVTLANQVSFLNRAVLDRTLNGVSRGGQVLLDARHTHYIDPDVLALIRDFTEVTGPARGVEVSLLGFRSKYELGDQIHFVDHSTHELQSALTPERVLQILKDGHERFRRGERLTRDLGRQVAATAGGQHPLAVVLSCMDSRNPAELVFDMGVGDIFSVRIAGNVLGEKVFGSLEFACAVAGAKLILVMGHTRCGAVTAAVRLICSPGSPPAGPACQHIGPIVDEIRHAIDPAAEEGFGQLPANGQEAVVNAVARRNVARAVELLPRQSETLGGLVRAGRIAVVGAMYDVTTGEVEFLAG